MKKLIIGQLIRPRLPVYKVNGKKKHVRKSVSGCQTKVGHKTETPLENIICNLALTVYSPYADLQTFTGIYVWHNK